MKLSILALVYLLTGCLGIHHVQIGEIDQTGGGKLKPFDVKISETGLSLQEAGQVASNFAGKADRQNIGQAGDIISMFQMGPKTGKPVYNDRYAEKLGEVLLEECPSGRITGLMVVRETREYPVISGEIIKVLGYCKGGS